MSVDTCETAAAGTPHASSPKGLAPWTRIRDWLDRVPIDDPVDRRNASFMQLFMIYLGSKTLPYKIHLLLFNSAYQVLLPGHTWPGAPPYPLAFDLGADTLMTVSAWLGLYLIRRGAFRIAVLQLLGAMATATLIAYAAFGYRIWNADMTAFEVFALAGFMHGRKALWSAYLFFMCIYAAGMTTDYFRSPRVLHSAEAYAVLPSLALSYLVAVIILDRTSIAFRRSLAESNLHRRQLQREMSRREQAQEQLLHAQKMDAVGKLASGIAHDLNNVLGIVLGFAEERHRLDEPGPANDEKHLALARALQGVELAARRGAAVTRKLLNFSRMEVTRLERFDAGDALRDLQPLLRQMLPPSVRLKLDIPPQPLPIRFDHSQFELAILNLASNARDAMPDGGTLALSAALAGDELHVVVRDDGTGMPEEVVQRVFEPFYTTKPVDQGTGLGLSVVYGLVSHAGGRIDVESASGAGTRFHIRLPLAAPSPADRLPPLVGAGAVHVMLIDDDDDLRRLLSASLEEAGCLVSTAATGAQARRLAGQPAFAPQVLVCDNRLPDIDGGSLLGDLRQRLPQVPAILISSYLDSDGRPDLPLDPFSERLPKPFSPERLVERVFAAAGHGEPAARPPAKAAIDAARDQVIIST